MQYLSLGHVLQLRRAVVAATSGDRGSLSYRGAEGSGIDALAGRQPSVR
jgi:hypothetical protein